jgi:hypothetical protein
MGMTSRGEADCHTLVLGLPYGSTWPGIAKFPAVEEEGDDILEGEPGGLEEIRLCDLWKGSCMLTKAAIA